MSSFNISKLIANAAGFTESGLVPGLRREKASFQPESLLAQARRQAPPQDDAQTSPESGEDGQPIMEQGMSSLDEMREEAYNMGVQAGLEQAEAQLADTVQALASALEEIGRIREDIFRNSEQDMVRLVIAVAEQVIHTEIAIKDDVILSVLNEALHLAIAADEMVLRISPADLDMVKKKKPALLTGISGLKSIVIEADPAVAKGGCKVESNLGVVDATIHSQLEEIRQHLMSSTEKG